MCIERFLETVERFLVKYEELTIHDDFFCTLTGRLKNKADPVNTENFSGCINKIPLLRISLHRDENRLKVCRRDSLHGYNSGRL